MPLGSISELPADSCREIKASEGDKAVNGWYWLTTPGSHHVSLSYCLMKTGKGKVYRCYRFIFENYFCCWKAWIKIIIRELANKLLTRLIFRSSSNAMYGWFWYNPAHSWCRLCWCKSKWGRYSPCCIGDILEWSTTLLTKTTLTLFISGKLPLRFTYSFN